MDDLLLDDIMRGWNFSSPFRMLLTYTNLKYYTQLCLFHLDDKLEYRIYLWEERDDLCNG